MCVSYPEGNTNVYTANSYYRELMEAAGEIRSAALVAASVPIRGGALAAAAAFLAAKAAEQPLNERELFEDFARTQAPIIAPANQMLAAMFGHPV